ncbi:MAG: mechanosensitive ion channel family protein [Bacilli bacterium]|jgi:small conductance mechanosensitive channel|nr:mechanosensitive ion channel family protein [Bacilli bacterium]
MSENETKEKQGNKIVGNLPDYLEKNIKEAKKIKEIDRQELKKASRRQKAGFIVAAILSALFIVAAFLILFCRQVFGDEAANALYGQNSSGEYYQTGFSWLWEKAGIKLVDTLIVIGISLLLIFVVTSFIKAFSGQTKKSKTVGSLVRSCFKYLVIILAIAFVLGIWGVDVASIIAGLGVLTLIIGLGCQSLIQDVISGLFIVFDDYFSVGDMVIIDGFRGTIADIGLRTVKLDDGCGDIKAITNSSINTCVNLSRSPNLIIVTMDISYNEDLEHVEGVIARELPKLKAQIPQMKEGPWYKGLDSFDNCGLNLSFMCTCNAEDRFQVKRDFQRDIYQFLTANDILIPYQQITVNPEDPENRQPATGEDKKLAAQLNQANRALPVKENKTLLQRAKESLGTDDLRK